MKANRKTTLLMALVLLFTFTMAVPCWAAEKEEQDIWAEDAPRWGRGRFEPTEENIEHIMNRLKETDPEKAQELAQLQEKDPKKFKVELRKVAREHFRKKMMEHRQGMVPGNAPHHPPGRGGFGGGRGGAMDMRERHAEYLQWLEKNYPEKAKELAELKEKNPELYMRSMMLGMRKYRRILWASKDNPELAEVLKKDLELKQERDELVRKIRAATKDEEKQELTTQLENVVGGRFDLIVKRKQIEYEQLLERLEKLKQEIKERETEVEKWKEANFKNKNVKNRVEQLISKTEEINWD